MNNNQVIESFYNAFSNGNAEGMIECYHDEVEFEDPAFGRLKGERAKNMWRMLLSNKNSNLKVVFSNVKCDENVGSANWEATYLFGAKKRKVVNRIDANFHFKDGKIIKHKDSFDSWKWSGQALGIPGWLFGWTPFMKAGIKKKTNFLLNKFIERKQD